MSLKWQRTKKWDNENLSGIFTPVKWILGAFSSITLAVILLLLLAAYGTLASVPIGLLALIPTKLFYYSTLVLPEIIILTIIFQLLKTTNEYIKSPAARFLIKLFSCTGIALAVAYVWWIVVYPAINYLPGDPPTGIRFFGSFVDKYRVTMLRQLPSWEMLEIEFYSWWPFRLILVLFVINMIMATVRRIEFKFVNIGVLTVHTGIVTLAIGSIIYSRNKVEGDLLLLRAAPPVDRFYDNLTSSLYVIDNTTGRKLEFPLPRLPRYNNAPAGTKYAPNFALHSLPGFDQLFNAAAANPSNAASNIKMTVKGIIPYGQPTITLTNTGLKIDPSINVNLQVKPDKNSDTLQNVFSERLRSSIPGQSTLHDIFTIQYISRTDTNTNDNYNTYINNQTVQFPSPAQHLLIIQLPNDNGNSDTNTNTNTNTLYPVAVGDEIKIKNPTPGQPDWIIQVDRYQPSDQGLSIITPGYEGAASSRLIVNVTKPDGSSFSRHIMSRYPELTQDFHFDDENNPAAAKRGMPRRTPPDPAINMSYIDAAKPHVYIIQNNPLLPQFDIIKRKTGGSLTINKNIDVTKPVTIGQFQGLQVSMLIQDLWTHTTNANTVVPVPRQQQERDFVGKLVNAFIDLEIQTLLSDGKTWTNHQWLSYHQYPDKRLDAEYTPVNIPGYGSLEFCFGRHQQPLPNITVQFTDFKMIPYPGTNTPRDYISTLNVYTKENPAGSEHITKLNHPYIYKAPWSWNSENNFVTNTIDCLIHLIAPNQYKFSQSGWDPEKQAYTILGVGNNPGIYLVAAGGILMALGIPWAFYIKPALLKRKQHKRRLPPKPDN